MERLVVPGRRLGRLPKVDDPRNLRLGRYLAGGAQPPARLDLAAGIARFPLYGNHRLCDCTAAAAAHMVEVWSRQVAGRARLFRLAEVVALYDLVNNGRDRGASMLRLLRAWRKVGLAGDRILAFAEVDVRDRAQARLGCWLFSGLFLGLEMPAAASRQEVWDVAPGPEGKPGSWGKHTVNVVGYDADGLVAVTWGRLQRMTWAFWDACAHEAYVCLPSEYSRLPSRPLENGLDLAALQRDLAAVASRG
jgi:hypothetical protein